MKDKKGIAITYTFQNIWLDKSSEFYNGSKKSWLEKNDIEMYSAHNEEYNSTYHSKIKVKPVDVKSST